MPVFSGEGREAFEPASAHHACKSKMVPKSPALQQLVMREGHRMRLYMVPVSEACSFQQLLWNSRKFTQGLKKRQSWFQLKTEFVIACLNTLIIPSSLVFFLLRVLRLIEIEM